MLPELLGWPGWIGRRGCPRCPCWTPTARSGPVSTCPHRQRAARVDPPPGPARRGPGRDRATRRPGRGGAVGRWAGGRRDPGSPGQALRGRYGTAGNKDDRFDAYVLADALGTDGHRLAPLRPDAPQTTALRVVSRPASRWWPPGWHSPTSSGPTSRSASQVRRRCSATSTAQSRWPFFAASLGDPGGLADRGPPGGIPAPHGYPGRKAAAELLRRLADAPAGLTGPEGEARATVTLGLVAALDTVRARIDELEGEVVERLGTHPDAAIFTALPRSGRVRAAALLAEIGDCRARFPDAESRPP
jgi:hypothetical protein